MINKYSSSKIRLCKVCSQLAVANRFAVEKLHLLCYINTSVNTSPLSGDPHIYRNPSKGHQQVVWKMDA